MSVPHPLLPSILIDKPSPLRFSLSGASNMPTVCIQKPIYLGKNCFTKIEKTFCYDSSKKCKCRSCWIRIFFTRHDTPYQDDSEFSDDESSDDESSGDESRSCYTDHDLEAFEEKSHWYFVS